MSPASDLQVGLVTTRVMDHVSRPFWRALGNTGHSRVPVVASTLPSVLCKVHIRCVCPAQRRQPFRRPDLLD